MQFLTIFLNYLLCIYVYIIFIIILFCKVEALNKLKQNKCNAVHQEIMSLGINLQKNKPSLSMCKLLFNLIC